MLTETKLYPQMSTIEKLLYYAAALFLPNIFLFNLYNTNHESANLVFRHVFVLALILAATSTIMMTLVRWFVRNYEGSLLVSLLVWLFFWNFESINSLIPIDSKVVLLISITVIVLCFVIRLRSRGKNLYKIRTMFNALAGVLCLLFIFNFLPAVLENIEATPEDSVEQAEFHIRTEFSVDSTLPNPDIYWFHVDGMINFEDMAFLYDDNQEGFKQYLTDRGFVINENAKLVGHNTYFNVPALFSPDFYDSYLGDLTSQMSETALRIERSKFLHRSFRNDGISLANDIAPYHELFHALLQADYKTVSIADYDERVFVPLDHFYRLGEDMSIFNQEPYTVGSVLEEEEHFLKGALDLVELLALATPIPYRSVTRIRMGSFDWEPIPTHEDKIEKLTANTRNLNHERQLYRGFIDSFSIDGPKLIHVTSLFTHAARWHWQFDELGRWDSHTDLYPTAHAYSANMLMNMIDMILETNPNPVIVIQSDHGFHLNDTQMQLLEAGFTEKEVADIQNSVMSAVLIPEQYGGLDLEKPLDPLNITRELVNRFVGENYQLLEK